MYFTYLFSRIPDIILENAKGLSNEQIATLNEELIKQAESTILKLCTDYGTINKESSGKCIVKCNYLTNNEITCKKKIMIQCKSIELLKEF
jgi:hypothetical protein